MIDSRPVRWVIQDRALAAQYAQNWLDHLAHIELYKGR
jgi:hypothetical protein